MFLFTWKKAMTIATMPTTWSLWIIKFWSAFRHPWFHHSSGRCFLPSWHYRESFKYKNSNKNSLSTIAINLFVAWSLVKKVSWHWVSTSAAWLWHPLLIFPIVNVVPIFIRIDTTTLKIHLKSIPNNGNWWWEHSTSVRCVVVLHDSIFDVHCESTRNAASEYKHQCANNELTQK